MAENKLNEENYFIDILRDLPREVMKEKILVQEVARNRWFVCVSRHY
jgi:hypothetical protein